MAYIDAEKTAEIRKELKEKFPKPWKFSVRNQHHSSIAVSIIEAPINFLEDYDDTNLQVNHYYLDDHWEGTALAALKDITKIVNEGNFDKSDLMTDYHHVGWYFDLQIGKYDKPFKHISE